MRLSYIDKSPEPEFRIFFFAEVSKIRIKTIILSYIDNRVRILFSL